MKKYVLALTVTENIRLHANYVLIKLTQSDPLPEMLPEILLEILLESFLKHFLTLSEILLLPMISSKTFFFQCVFKQRIPKTKKRALPFSF